MMTLAACGGGGEGTGPVGIANDSAVAPAAAAGTEPDTVAANEPDGTAQTQAVTLPDTPSEPTPTTNLACTPASPPAPIAQELVATSDPLSVPKAFLGMHVGVRVPVWIDQRGDMIPPPKYPYGYTRTLKVDIGGLSERGFWSNIELEPGQYDWQYMDGWMTATAGHPVIWLIYGTPPFYQLYPDEPSRWATWPGIASPPTAAGHVALAKFIAAVKSRYGDRIVAFEVWNEPSLPWTSGATSYDDRWTPSWGNTNSPRLPQPFFSGSASDMANIAYTVKQAAGDVPVLGAGFVDQWEPEKTSMIRIMNAPVTLPGASGRGGDQFDAMSVHFYDYDRNPLGLLDAMRGYRAWLTGSNWPTLPIWLTEVGAEAGGRFMADEPAAGQAIVRWSVLSAALKAQSLVLYGHIHSPDRDYFLGDPVYGPNTIAALNEAAQLNGAKICQAGVLSDGRVWANLAGGVALLR